jgi:hypothetical protein
MKSADSLFKKEKMHISVVITMKLVVAICSQIAVEERFWSTKISYNQLKANN